MSFRALNDALTLASAVLDGIVVVLVLVRRVRFPLFLSYVCFSAIAEAVMLWVGRNGDQMLYFEVYWIAQGIYTVLALLAMNESFRVVLLPYYSRRQRLTLQIPALVLLVTAVMWWKAVSHAPIEAHPVMTAYISFNLAADYMQAGVYGLFMLNVMYRQIPWKRHPFGIMQGFGLFSIVRAAADLLRSDFGTKMNSFFAYGPAVAYIIACGLWIVVFSKPEPVLPRSSTPLDLDQLLTNLRRLTKR